jgi:hypothetical protein
MIGGSAMEGIPAVVNYVQEKGGHTREFFDLLLRESSGF